MIKRKHKLFGKAIKHRRELERGRKISLHFYALLENIEVIFERIKELAKPYGFDVIEMDPWYPYHKLVFYTSKMLYGKKYSALLDVATLSLEPTDEELLQLINVMDGAHRRRQECIEAEELIPLSS